MPPRFPWRLVVLGSVAVASLAACLVLPPLQQPKAYHQFADVRAWMGIPNAQNVLSNAPFLIVACIGLHVLRRQRQAGVRTGPPASDLPLFLFFVGVGLTMPGSSYYHCNPDNKSLVWDRLPMAVAFMGLLSEVIARRVHPAVGQRLMVPLQAAGMGSVLYWAWSESRGNENLWPYVAVQFGSILLIILILTLFPAQRKDGSARLWRVIAWYGAAKLLESLDRPVFGLGEVVGGHALKHLAAALAAFGVVQMLREDLKGGAP